MGYRTYPQSEGVVMTARLWTVLLVLAGVFAVHGLQCASSHAAGHAAGPAIGAPHAVAFTAGIVDAPGGHLAVAGADAGTAHHPTAAPTPAGATAPASPTGHDSTSEQSAGHLWSLCLAVLVGGLAALLPLLASRPSAPAAPALRRALHRTRSWSAPLRPPDLAALCLLRI
jgi:hypothetical protein